jgi:alpha-L-fucosidase
MLVNSVASGGNLLMNVGPTARGTFDERARHALGVYRDWMRLNARSIYGCTQSEFAAPPDCRFTQNGKRLYLHVFSWPFRHIHLDGLADKVEYAQLLHDASEIKLTVIDPHQQAQNTTMGGSRADTLTLELPVRKPDVVVPVIELFLK